MLSSSNIPVYNSSFISGCKMEWNILKEIESNFLFPSDTAQSLTACDLNQWDGAASTCFDQFMSYNFVSSPLEDSPFDDWKLMDMSYNLEPTSSEEPAFDGTKLDTLEKGLSQLVNRSGCEVPNTLCLEECHEGTQDCKMLGLDQVNDNFMLVHQLLFLEIARRI